MITEIRCTEKGIAYTAKHEIANYCRAVGYNPRENVRLRDGRRLVFGTGLDQSVIEKIVGRLPQKKIRVVRGN